jgi:hypothetical protein
MQSIETTTLTITGPDVRRPLSRGSSAFYVIVIILIDGRALIYLIFRLIVAKYSQEIKREV